MESVTIESVVLVSSAYRDECFIRRWRLALASSSALLGHSLHLLKKHSSRMLRMQIVFFILKRSNAVLIYLGWMSAKMTLRVNELRVPYLGSIIYAVTRSRALICYIKSKPIVCLDKLMRRLDSKRNIW